MYLPCGAIYRRFYQFFYRFFVSNRCELFRFQDIPAVDSYQRISKRFSVGFNVFFSMEIIKLAIYGFRVGRPFDLPFDISSLSVYTERVRFDHSVFSDLHLYTPASDVCMLVSCSLKYNWQSWTIIKYLTSLTFYYRNFRKKM